MEEEGRGAGAGFTVNLPYPPGATGDAFRAAIDDVVVPLAEAWSPTWLLVSAGFDGHRDDPLTDLGLSAGDYADLASAVLPLVPAGRRLVFLEGGYDLQALARSAGACVAAMAGVRHAVEAPTSGGPGRTVVDAVRLRREHSGRG